MSQLLTLSTDPAEPNIIAEVWATLKEVFGFLAQHPQLMGVGLIGLGLVVKRTHTFVLRPGIVLTNPPADINPQNPRFKDWFVEMPGFDVSLVKYKLALPGVPAPGGGNIAVDALSNFGAWLGGIFPQLKPALNQVSQTVQNPLDITTLDITLGDALMLGGFAALVGPALQPLLNLIPKI